MRRAQSETSTRTWSESHMRSFADITQCIISLCSVLETFTNCNYIIVRKRSENVPSTKPCASHCKNES